MLDMKQLNKVIVEVRGNEKGKGKVKVKRNSTISSLEAMC